MSSENWWRLDIQSWLTVAISCLRLAAGECWTICHHKYGYTTSLSVTCLHQSICCCVFVDCATHLLIFWTASHASHRRDLLHVVQSTMCVCLYVCVLGTPVSPAKTVEPIEMPFRRRLTCAQEIVNRSAAHWHHLTNTIKQSIRGGDATMRQITLTVSSSVEAVTQLRSLVYFAHVSFQRVIS